MGAILRGIVAHGEASLPPCDPLAKQRWLDEVKADVKYSGRRLPHYVAVCQQFVGLTDFNRWKAAFPVHGFNPQLKFLEDVTRAEGLEHQVADICARLALQPKVRLLGTGSSQTTHTRAHTHARTQLSIV